ncbi:hypothetical protein Kisp01_08300 [Kineosporia sp. NBRC 101677]|uniref:SRPBCC family protein n=1 Tax=Kineosporia sp. NBRC 101677 TaxID=3032197 RepID=UPI0024A46544|nr:SRPBCC family protein [Kineosporia sp. NBRC 101677]GLY13814.1 hypothetical protein Kisp01_08300 [Kineosporia sp. NBRC 101677]
MQTSDPTGRITRDQNGARLVFTRAYSVPVQQLWAALTEPEQTARWIGRWEGDPTSGTVSLHMSAEEGTPASPVRIDSCAAPYVLAVTTPAEGEPWTLRLVLSSTASGSSLTFTHEQAGSPDLGSIGPGWEFYLDRLAAVLDGGEVPEDFEKYYPVRASAYA